MANEYVSDGEIKARLSEVKVPPAAQPDLDLLREAVSRFCDGYIGVRAGFFIPSVVPTTKRIYGTGASFLNLPAPLRGSVTIVAAPGYDVPNFTLDDNRLVTLTEEDIRDPTITWGRAYYDITGLWGYPAIPPELKEAVLQIVIRFYRGRDEGFSGVIGGIRTDNTIIERSLPAPARLILDTIRSRVGVEVGPEGTTGSSFYIA